MGEAASEHRFDAVALDTDIWSLLYSRKGKVSPDVSTWRRLLMGRRVVIATQTRAEVIAGMRSARWGERRTHEVMAQLDHTLTLPVDEAVIEAYAELTAAARTAGHAIADKIHVADRWIAASAIAFGLPLLSQDGIFREAPGLRVMGGEALHTGIRPRENGDPTYG